MGAPAVTVVIPAFNAELHIAETLASVRDQTLRGVEVIVVDDGSTDGTLREVERFAGELDLVIMRQANAGASAARNAGVRRARGRYCAFLDADDLMLPERLAAQMELLDAETDLGLVHTDLMTFNERGIVHKTRRAFSDPCGGMVLDRLLLDNFITTSTVMAPKERLIDAGLFNLNRRISQDFELWLQMAVRWKVGFIDRPLVRYRYSPGGLSEDKLATARDALGVIEDFWREHPQHRRSHPSVYRNSLGAHLATAGAAALTGGSRDTAFTYLARSLWLDPWRRSSWKSLAKVVIPARLLPGRGPSVAAASPDEG
jgi:glycosyltransferase involved in cell wall biosynthesis